MSNHERARTAWIELGQAVQTLFGFKGHIEAEPLEKVLASGDNERITKFISQVENLTADVKATVR